jgi:glycosyltransferase involved in cell wall biosynthesis
MPYQGDSNPYLRLLAGSLESLGVHVHLVRGTRLGGDLGDGPSPAVVHLQWQHRLFVPKSGGLLRAWRVSMGSFRELRRLRQQGVALVWTVHNVVNHERRFTGWELRCCRRLARTVDALIVHCDAAKQTVVEAYGVDPVRVHVVPHGHYAGWYSQTAGRGEARAEWALGPDERVFLFFGQLRAYKGLERLIRSFRDLDGDDLRLIVAGQPKAESLVESLEQLSRGDTRVRFLPEYLSDERLVSLVSASDVVVLPYLDSLTSGAAILAASLGRPVVMPRLGCMGEFPPDGAFLYDPHQPSGLESALRAAVSGELEQVGSVARTFVSGFDWDQIGARTVSIYEAAVA